ncbi:hypothetical protein AQUCO_01700689v1 [Aquilegia coerulea]|uniref:non-specific serine/threonine protein kinase n=1 Tax=Aquilegia coerulea TaxID=218851 RepID=A0A2G5DP95_AQUCA|nr:hypothetical protein AQUCO_01700689v1 [Aquilegia coerulea]
MNLSSAYAHVLGNETDRLALLAIKDKITQDPSGILYSWNKSIHFCNWEGVICSQRHQRVIMLDLMSKGIIGSLSPYIGNLSFLRTIDLRNNSFHSQIPHEIGRLFRLQILLMGNNSFSGQLPTNLSQCSNLINFTIGHNNLVGEIPMDFGSLSKLIALGLHDNNLTGRIPASFGNLSSLEALGLTSNKFYGSIPGSITQLQSLLYISLADNMFSGMVPQSFYNISSLQYISFAKNQLEGSLPPEIGLNLPNLFGFLIGGNQFSGSIPISLVSNASKLQNLDLAYNSFTGNVPIEVGSLQDLQVLALGTNGLGGGGKDDDMKFLTSLNNCSNLQLLDIYGNQFGGRLPISVVNLSNTFGYLYLGNNQIVGSLPSEIGNLVNLMLLSVEMNFLTGIIPKGIGMLQNLQYLGLSGNRFSGQIPDSVGNNSQLYYLDLSDNKLEGNVLSNFEKYQSLQILNLSHNHFTGTIPKKLFELSGHLTTLSLAHNSLFGQIPSEVGNLQNLQSLDISENKLTGDIPVTLGDCLSLESLYLQGNILGGVIPSSLSHLKGLKNFDISRNNLSGDIPKYLENLLLLKSLNLSFNNLEGEVPTKGIFQNASAISLVGNSKLCGGMAKLELEKCYFKKSEKHGMHLALKVALGVLLPSLVIASLLLAFCFTRRPGTRPSSEEFLKDGLERISYNELRKATDGFSLSNLIGVGSYGSVYKGVLHQNEGPIAVKVLNLMETGASKSFIAECEVLRKVRHRNLLKILTVCSSVDFEGNDFKALVFKFMHNGSVEDWLHPSSDSVLLPRYLNLWQMLNIAIDVAFALDYLHNHCEIPIVHCDLKSSNILLDHDMAARVGDFGLAKFLRKTSSGSGTNESNSFAVRGTIGYIPPEYGMGAQVSTQGDLYSYGIFLLEMLTGKRPTDMMFKDGVNLHQWTRLALTDQGVMDIIDTRLVSEGDPNETTYDSDMHKYTREQLQECIISIMNIGVACSAESIVERMEIKDVLAQMHAIKKKFAQI